ncbi:hypothetical protein [Mesorhizobium sp. L2C067A000]|uniref:hypothetical protein n=1 Tax=Mesorhizobium sp. L2C067A000 TaxID=1287106 RepID=UPI0003D018B8|nr:hypothetical protein [Mesorhizobium sp. L2C067A000]ESZ29629.1 hypothetical protein X733_25005 [Mesorhizobium sp. L2C067A000]
MTPSQAVEFGVAALSKVHGKVLADYEANLKKLDINEAEISKRVDAYRQAMDSWFQRSVAGIKSRHPIH